MHGDYLMLVNTPADDWLHAVLATPQLIGRSLVADIAVPEVHTSVARRHAEIWKEQGACYLRDLASGAGTHVNSVGFARIKRRIEQIRAVLGSQHDGLPTEVEKIARKLKRTLATNAAKRRIVIGNE